MCQEAYSAGGYFIFLFYFFTSAVEPILYKENLERCVKRRTMLVDISVPRNIDDKGANEVSLSLSLSLSFSLHMFVCVCVCVYIYIHIW
jgi:hypothetical protein